MQLVRIRKAVSTILLVIKIYLAHHTLVISRDRNHAYQTEALTPAHRHHALQSAEALA